MENRSFGLHSPAAAGDLGAERKARRPGPDTSREGGRLCRSAPRSLALFNTPWPTWRTLKLHCALFSQPQPFPTLHRAAARARAGGARARAGAGAARHGARVPPTPGPPASGLASPGLARSARPPRARPARCSSGGATSSAPARALGRPARRAAGMLRPASWARAPVTAGRPRRASAAQCGRSRDLEIKTHAKSQANSLSRTKLSMSFLTGSASSQSPTPGSL